MQLLCSKTRLQEKEFLNLNPKIDSVRTRHLQTRTRLVLSKSGLGPSLSPSFFCLPVSARRGRDNQEVEKTARTHFPFPGFLFRLLGCIFLNSQEHVYIPRKTVVIQPLIRQCSMYVLHGGIARQKMHTKQARKDAEIQTPLFV